MIKDTKLIKFVKTASTYMSSKSVKNIPEDKRFEYFMNMAERIQKLAYVDEAERKEALDTVWGFYEKALKMFNKKAKYSATAVDETWGGASRGTGDEANSYKISNSTGGYTVNSYGNELEDIVGAEMYGDKSKGITSIKKDRDYE